MATTITVTDTGGAADMRAPDAGDTVLATDYNSMLANVERLLLTPNDVSLGTFTAADTWGLNQSETENAASVGDEIIATGTPGAFKDLQDEIQALQTFFGQTTETITDVAAGDSITAADWAAAARAIEDCWDGRLGHTPSAVSSGTSNVYTTSWGVAGSSEKLTTTVTYTFANEATCRGFFNGGGYIGVGDMSMSGTGHNADWDTVVAAAGDVMINYNSNTGTEASTGFYELGTTDTVIYSSNLGGVYTGDLFTIAVKVNSVTDPTIVTFTVVMDDADDNVVDETLDGDFTINCRRRLPDTTGTGFSFSSGTEAITFAVSAT